MAELIRTLNKVYDLKISVEELLKQASAIKRTMKEIAESYQKMRKEEDLHANSWLQFRM